ncbi:MAG: DNA alkylation repair protein [Bacteroidota bacterium]
MPEPLKNLYSKALISQLADSLHSSYNAFDKSHFIKTVFDKDWDNKELKQRMRHITNSLHKTMPVSYSEQVDILKKLATHFTGFTAMVFPDFMEVYGLNDLDTSINALEHFTQYSSSEFAVRPFIIKYPKQMLKQHALWSKHKNHHVRRLASEGIRPRLPWAIALPEFKKDPKPILPILNNLMADESEYVRRSVANCINDISKDHPQIVLQIINQWQKKSVETDWILKHASRGLLKKGHAEILNSFGLNHQVKTKLTHFSIDKKNVAIGDSIHFNFGVQLLEKQEAKVRLEYNIYYHKANGKQLPKIFQIGTYTLQPNQVFEVKKKHAFINLTTRKHYKGQHTISILANGNELDKINFMLND